MKTGITLLLFLASYFPLVIDASIHRGDPSKLPDDARKLYIDFMKKVLLDTVYEVPRTDGPVHQNLREAGENVPSRVFTMSGLQGLDNIQECLEYILENNIPGDCIETGVWRGGGTILMRGILKAYGDKTRKVWVADSFQGVPAPNTSKYPADAGSAWHTNRFPYLTVPLDQVQHNFDRFQLLDDQVVFLKGLFFETLPTAPIEQLSLLRLDGYLYESTMDALVHLYPKLSTGGFVIVEGYGPNPNCTQAVNDYRAEHGVGTPMVPVDNAGAYWQKTK